MSSRLLSHHHTGILTLAALMTILFTSSCTDADRYSALRDRLCGLAEAALQARSVHE